MTNYSGWLAGIAAVMGVASAPLHLDMAVRSGGAIAPGCVADSNYQRLAFWVGDWEVYDSVGTRYATQRVRAVLDACAITAEWTGPVGNHGLGVSAFDVRAGEWRQVYVSNQVPSPSGVTIRKSDRSYGGPGIRFIPMLDPAPGNLARSRITILPLSEHRALQLFETSSDGGETWRTVFKAEHRLQPASR
jgi:hypothetical protein